MVHPGAICTVDGMLKSKNYLTVIISIDLFCSKAGWQFLPLAVCISAVIARLSLGHLALARGNADSFKEQSSKGFSVLRVVNNESVVGKIYRYTGGGGGGGGARGGNQNIPFLVQFRTGLCQ